MNTIFPLPPLPDATKHGRIHTNIYRAEVSFLDVAILAYLAALGKG